METVIAPLDPNGFSGFMTTTDCGLVSVGKVINIEYEEINRELYFTFDVELDDDIELSDAAIYIFRNGSLYERISTSATNWTYNPNADSTLEAFEFFIGPNNTGMEKFIDVIPIKNCVRLSWVPDGLAWTAGGDAKKLVIKHCYGSGTPDTEIATLTRVGAHMLNETGSMGGIMHAAGTWEDPGILWSKIIVRITSAGDVDTATYSWTWKSFSGSGICRSYPDHIVNGVKIWFDEDYYYEYDEDWTVYICLPTEWTSGRFTIGGVSTFGVNSVNSAGDEATGPTVEVELFIPPDPPVLTGTPVYVQGSGEIEITWTAPDTPSSALASYRVYRNWPHTGSSLVDWAWEYSGAVTAGATFTVTVTGLEEGYNRIQATVVDELGNESALSTAWEITLNSSLNEITDHPNPPDSISAVMDTSGNLIVTVWADATSDTIYLYHDSHTGTINYNIAVATITNPMTSNVQKLRATISSGLTDGIYLIGARCEKAGALETNTDMVCSVLRDKDTPAIVSLLTGVGVSA